MTFASEKATTMTKNQRSEQEKRKQLGNEIRDARMRLGITQAELAERMSSLLDSAIGTSTVSKIESGSRSLSFAEAQAAGQILILSLDKLGGAFSTDRGDRILDLLKLQLSNILSCMETIQSSTHIVDELCTHLVDMDPRDRRQEMLFELFRSYGHESYDRLVERDSEFNKFAEYTRAVAKQLDVKPKNNNEKRNRFKDIEQ